METALVILIVASAAVWLIRDYTRAFKTGEGACKCGCASCSINPSECQTGQDLFKEIDKD